MTEENQTTNIDRLIAHLEENTLACQLAEAYKNAQSGVDLRNVLRQRFERIKQTHESSEYKQD